MGYVTYALGSSHKLLEERIAGKNSLWQEAPVHKTLMETIPVPSHSGVEAADIDEERPGDECLYHDDSNGKIPMKSASKWAQVITQRETQEVIAHRSYLWSSSR